MKKTLFGLVALAAVFACAKEDPKNDIPNVFEGDKAYMSITISDANAVTKAPVFDYGTADEHGVKSAHFYFYDKFGAYVAEAQAWNGGNANDATPDQNIEFEASNVVVLSGLKQKLYPEYMVTVLNRDADFKPGNTLQEMEDKLADDDGVGIITADGEFTMTTTSYVNGIADANNPVYFVNKLVEENFALEPIKADYKYPVTVYVERLAAKVSLTTNMTQASTTLEDGTVGYKIMSTVAGTLNDQENAKDENGNVIGEKDLYVKFSKWGLNATAKRSHIMKNIDPAWTFTDFFTDWNDAANYRSYWGKSYNYGDNATNGYPTPETGVNPANFLDYKNFAQVGVDFGQVDYCAENTNVPGTILTRSNVSRVATNVLVSAVVCDKSGEALNLVRYNGVLFLMDDFVKYVLTSLNQQNKLNVYRKVDEQYVQLGVGDVEIVTKGGAAGLVKVQIKDSVTELWSLSNDVATPYDKATFDTDFAGAFENVTAYKDGQMYYTIPIAHLAKPAATPAPGADLTAVPTYNEGEYGVVRNHFYQLNVSKVDQIGKGVFDPNEVIIPDDPKDEQYYLGASIKILSWRVVNQNVEL